MKLIVALLFAIFFSSCGYTVGRNDGQDGADGIFGNGISGNGKIKTETRNITSDFQKIESNEGILVIVEQSESKSVTVEADENIISHIITKVENGTLIVESDNAFNTGSTPTVKVKMPKISGLDALSGSSIRSTNTLITENIKVSTSSGSNMNITVEADDITTETSSGSSMEVSGKALKLSTDSSSGSTLNAGNLLTNEVTSRSSSGSSTDVNPILSLNAKASSGSSINYKNAPKTIKKEEDSGGSVSL